MSRTIILLLAVILLGTGAYFVMTSEDVTERTLSDDSEGRKFAYRDIDNVHEIRVADRNGHSVTLTRGGVSGWKADGRPANENIMKNVLVTVRQLDIRSLPSQNMVSTMVRDLAASGILVQLFDRQGQKLQGYYIGGAAPGGIGNYAIREGSEDPYIVHIPGFSGSIRSRFEHWGDEWRDKVYFRIDPDKVETFSIEYPKQRSNSFVLTRIGNKYQLAPFYETEQATRMIPAGGVEGALAKYEKYYVNMFENEDEKAIKKFRDMVPFAIIRVKQEGLDEQEMVIYPRYKDDVLTDDPIRGALVRDGGLTAFSAFINDGEDWVLLNVETLQPLLFGYDYF